MQGLAVASSLAACGLRGARLLAMGAGGSCACLGVWVSGCSWRQWVGAGAKPTRPRLESMCPGAGARVARIETALANKLYEYRCGILIGDQNRVIVECQDFRGQQTRLCIQDLLTYLLYLLPSVASSLRVFSYPLPHLSLPALRHCDQRKDGYADSARQRSMSPHTANQAVHWHVWPGESQYYCLPENNNAERLLVWERNNKYGALFRTCWNR